MTQKEERFVQENNNQSSQYDPIKEFNKTNASKVFLNHNSNRPVYYVTQNNIYSDNSLRRNQDIFTFYPDSTTSKLKINFRQILPTLEIKNKDDRWQILSEEYEFTGKDMYYHGAYKQIDTASAYQFTYKEPFGDTQVTARLRLDIIQNKSDKSSIYSKPFKTTIPSFFLTNLDASTMQSLIRD